MKLINPKFWLLLAVFGCVFTLVPHYVKALPQPNAECSTTILTSFTAGWSADLISSVSSNLSQNLNSGTWQVLLVYKHAVGNPSASIDAEIFFTKNTSPIQVNVAPNSYTILSPSANTASNNVYKVILDVTTNIGYHHPSNLFTTYSTNNASMFSQNYLTGDFYICGYTNASLNNSIVGTNTLPRDTGTHFTFGTYYTYPAPAVSLSASPTVVNFGETSDLTWTASGSPTPTCTASNDWSGSKPVSGTAETDPIIDTNTYTLTCSNADSSTVKNAYTTSVIPTSSVDGGGEFTGLTEEQLYKFFGIASSVGIGFYLLKRLVAGTRLS